MASFKPDSAYGKAMAATKAGKARLDTLPNLPYVLALGTVGQNDPQTAKLSTDIIDGILKTDLLKSLPEEQKQRLQTIAREMNAEITGMQFVIGGAPAGKGLFGAACVFQCKDAEKVKGLLAEEAKLIEGMVKHFAGDNPDVKKLAIRYIKSTETVGSVSADAIIVEHPDMETMAEQDRNEMKKVLGEDKIRLLVAAPDATTVVVTFGGSRDFLTEALKTATGKGTIGTGEAAADAMKLLPANCNTVIMLNGGNLFELIVAGMKTMAPDAELPPFKITCKSPVVAGTGVTGSSIHVVFYVPTALAKDIAGIVRSVQGMGGLAAPPPLRGKEDL
jgi:hypothetical protein